MKYSGTALEQLTAATRKAVPMLRPEPEASVEPQPGQPAAPTTAELS